MGRPTARGGKEKKDLKADREIVQKAVDDLLDKSKKHGGIALAHVWTILWHRNPAHTTWKVLVAVVGVAVSVFSIGWGAHAIKLQVFPAKEQAVEPQRVPMPNVLDAKPRFVSTDAPDWLYPLVQRLEGGARAAVQVSVEFHESTEGDKVQLLSSADRSVAGYAFLVRKQEERESYEPLPRVEDEKLRFIVDVPPANPGDKLVFLTSVAGDVTKESLQTLFPVRRVK